MSREAFGDPPESQEPPQVCPLCGGEWHAEDCEFGKEVALRLKAERDAHRMQFALHRLWPVLERAIAGLVFTADRAGEVQANMSTLREYSKTQKQAPGCKTPAGCRENGCLGWCDEHQPEASAGVEDLQREVARLKVENARLAEETMRLQGLLNAAHQIVGELARPSGI